MFTELRTELKKIVAENEFLEGLLKTFSETGKLDRISTGLKVRIHYDNGTTQVGRVISFNPTRKQWMINRDGYAATIGISETQLEILNPGIEGIIDKNNWLNSLRIRELNKILAGSELPEYFLDKEFVNVKIVAKSFPSFGYNLIDCEIKGFNPVQRIKIPSSFAEIDNFLQLHIRDGEIFDIHVISRERYLNIE